MLFWTNPESSTLQNSSYMAIYLPSHKSSQQDMLDTAEEERFGLVSLFNGISTFFRLFNAKAIFLEEQ